MAKRSAKARITDQQAQNQAGGLARILEEYLSALNAIRATGAGVPETSYYPALSNLLNEVGGTLKPKVRCVINLANSGAGIPDGGLFTADQFHRQADGQPKTGQLPARGAVEVKAPKDDAHAVVRSPQVKKYLQTYGIVLVCNLREFLIVQRGPTGEPIAEESFVLAASEADFWRLIVAHPRDEAAAALAEPFVEFLKRACLHAAPLANPKDVAWFLASYARDALFRVEQQKKLPALQAVRSALEEALGMKFTDEKGEHFFRSTLVQTLFYGVFSAWVRWHKDRPGPNGKFDWRTAEWSLHVPFIRTLYHQIADPHQLGQSGLVEVLDWSAGVLNRVDRAEFFKNFEEHHAVQYFYEPFLEAYDPELRKALGVWYTPPEIVEYQVARVDQVLREELDLPDGLADPNVIVLDPCCGTGAYLVAVLHRIAATLRDKGGDALVASDLKRAAIDRVFGFEIMPAPFVVSHLQLGLMLQAQGAPLSQKKGERVGVYLTNALTGWEPPKGVKATPAFEQFHELQEEKDAAEHVKRDKKILVILGNPPYNGFAGMAVEEERSLSTAYRTTKKAPPPEGQGLNDLYVRFFRMAERRITEMSGEGVVCFISNYSWLDGRSHNGMRERFLEAFDRIWIDCLNGDKYKTGKTTPEGKPDPSVFSTPQNREGIQVGTAVALLARKTKHKDGASVRFRHFWGTSKLNDVLEAAKEERPKRYKKVAPQYQAGFPLVPSSATKSYFGWPRLTELLPVSFPGVKTSRDNAVVDIDRDRLLSRISQYFDHHTTNDEIRKICPQLMVDTSSFRASEVRETLCHRGFRPEYIIRYYYRPFDTRWLYWEPETNLIDRKREDYLPHIGCDNLWLSAGQHNRKADFYQPQVTRLLADHHVVESNAGMFPLFLMNDGRCLFEKRGAHPNVTEGAAGYVAAFNSIARDLFQHIVAVLHAPTYRNENAGPLRQDWPRIPLPDSHKTLEVSAALGERVAALLDTEADVPGVTCGKIAPVLKTIALVTKTGGGQLDASGDDLAVTAGWGHFGQAGAVMPGKGTLAPRAYSDKEAEALGAEASARGLSPTALRELVGNDTLDVHLNPAAYWRNVPRAVWEYTIGGYQVIKKWLSYRERPILGRPLSPDEAREVTNMARRIAALILLQPELDANYERVKTAAFDWSTL